MHSDIMLLVPFYIITNDILYLFEKAPNLELAPTSNKCPS